MPFSMQFRECALSFEMVGRGTTKFTTTKTIYAKLHKNREHERADSSK